MPFCKTRTVILTSGSATTHPVGVGEADPVAGVEDGRQEGGQLARALLRDVAHPGELVVEGGVQLLQDHGEHAHEPGPGAEVLGQALQQAGHEGGVVHGGEPDRPAHVVTEATGAALGVDGRPDGQAELEVVAVLVGGRAAEGLEGQALAPHALVHLHRSCP